MRLRIRRPRGLARDERGVGALEFALAAPVMILFIVGIARLGIMFFANAGLSSAVAEGARFATIFPTPTHAEIQARVTASRFGLESTRMSTPTITTGTTDGVDWIQITATYSVPMDFIFFSLPNVTLTETRRAFTQ